ncbi:hypothetical protein HDU98_010569 [Podochytrium sp. JEL0797]|nr:hypothetical protein HDU98_010569 [Podochytrium sp. JEL0797]
MTLEQDLFGGDISSDEEEPQHIQHSTHPCINGLRMKTLHLPTDQLESLTPHLHALFSPATGQNQAMRFGSEFPAFLSPLLSIAHDLLPKHLQSREPAFDQMIANHYTPGEGIAAHVDLARFEDGVVVFSFLSSLVMEFEHVGDPENHMNYSNDAFKGGNGQRVDVLLEPGSAVCLAGEARYNWTHGIAERMVDVYEGVEIKRQERISVTLRKMKPNQSSEGWEANLDHCIPQCPKTAATAAS